jgi:hypothetical protein
MYCKCVVVCKINEAYGERLLPRFSIHLLGIAQKGAKSEAGCLNEN